MGRPGRDIAAGANAAAAERAAAELLEYLDSVPPGTSMARRLLRHPREALRVARTVHALPRVQADLEPGREGTMIAKWLSRSFPIRTPLHEVTAMLRLPERSSAYADLPGRQTLRRKVREAQRLGVTWRRVDRLEERRTLLRLSEDRQRTHPNVTYRRSDLHHDEVLQLDLWLVAESADGDPLVVCACPVSGSWCLLRHLYALSDDRAASAARYLMTQVLVDQAVERGAKYLVDSGSPFSQAPGLRHFQKMLGFSVARVQVRRPSRRELEDAGLTWQK